MQFLNKYYLYKRTAFTLIEMLMVIVVVALLARMAVPMFVNYKDDARIQVTTERLMSLKTAIVGDARLISGGKYSKQGFEAHCLAAPTALSELITIPAAGTCSTAYDPFTKRGWRGPYVSNSASNYNIDAWGTALQYFVAGPPARTLRSCGPDLTCGTGDDITVTY